MTGGAGDDIYIVETAGDVVTEGANAGTDPGELAAYAYCDKKEPGLKRKSTTVTVEGNSTGSATAKCKRGSVAVSGGYGSEDPLPGFNPLTTVTALDLASIISGAVVTETVFQWRGMGDLLLNAIRTDDVYVVMAWLLVTATVVILFNLLADLLYAVLDPRIRYA